MSFLKFDIDDAKEYLFDELNFRNSHQSKYYPIADVFSKIYILISSISIR